MSSVTPELWDGGGGWSQLKFSLNSMYEQRQLVRNTWTKSNVALPLVRYCGCMFKFYRTKEVDYIVHWTNCLPMLDTEQQHTNAQPSTMLMYRKKVLVPSFQTEPHKRKPYIKKRIRPPPQLQNKWYFQQDLADTGLVLLTTTACDLDRFYISKLSQSNSISFTSINTTFFQSRNFQQTDLGTTYWGPKTDYWLWSNPAGTDGYLKDTIFLGQTRTKIPGQPLYKIKEAFASWPTTPLNHTQEGLYFGNVFDPEYMQDGQPILFTSGQQNSPSEIFKNYEKNKDQALVALKFGHVTQELYIDCRYTPNKDNGIGNEVFFLKNTRNENGWDAPNQEALVLRGFPLWLALWGYADWHKKLHLMQQIDLNYILVLKTSNIEPKLPGYVVLDESFQHGYSPYRNQHSTPPILPADSQNWLPKFKYQQITIDNICKTGPGTCKTSTNSIEAHCYYKFCFKWGGCPNQLENIADPVEQPKYPLPSYILQGLEVQNPESSPSKELYSFDFRRHMLTETAAKRIKTDSFTPTTLFPDATHWSAAAQKEETSSDEGEVSPQKEVQEDTIHQLQLEQRLLRKRIFRLMKRTPKLQYSNLK